MKEISMPPENEACSLEVACSLICLEPSEVAGGGGRSRAVAADPRAHGENSPIRMKPNASPPPPMMVPTQCKRRVGIYLSVPLGKHVRGKYLSPCICFEYYLPMYRLVFCISFDVYPLGFFLVE